MKLYCNMYDCMKINHNKAYMSDLIAVAFLPFLECVQANVGEDKQTQEDDFCGSLFTIQLLQIYGTVAPLLFKVQ